VNTQNTAVASATLTLERLPFEFNLSPTYAPRNKPPLTYHALNRHSNPLYEVIEDYQPQSLLDVASAIGGLLAALQGLHNLLFGVPLFWGLFGRKPLPFFTYHICLSCFFSGSKLLDPFGIFGNSKAAKKRMRARYGQIPRSENPKSQADQLALFLCDFLLETGPLAKEDDEHARQNSQLEETRNMCNSTEEGADLGLNHFNRRDSLDSSDSAWSVAAEESTGVTHLAGKSMYLSIH